MSVHANIGGVEPKLRPNRLFLQTPRAVVHNARLHCDTVWNWFMKRHDRYGLPGGLLPIAALFSPLAKPGTAQFAGFLRTPTADAVFVEYGFEPLH
jgi:hypothetical protein